MTAFSLSTLRAPPRFLKLGLWLVLLIAVGFLAAWGWSVRHRNLAHRLAAEQDLKNAWTNLLKAGWTWPLSADDQLLAARLARRLALADQAQAHLQAHERLGGDPNARLLEETLSRTQDGDLDRDREKELFELVANQHPESALILEALARGYLKANHPGGMFHVIELWSDAVDVTPWRGRLRHHLGQYAEARADLVPFVTQDPEDDDLRLALADACYQTGHLAESVTHYRVLEPRLPASAAVLLGLGMCLQDQAHLDEAAAVLDRLLEQDADHLKGLIERGRVAYRQGRLEDGARWGRRAITVDPNEPDGHLVLGMCLQAEGRVAEAREQLDRWQALEGGRYHLGQIMPKLARAPDDADLNYQAGSVFLLLGNQDLAVKHLEHALQINPGHLPTQRVAARHGLRLDANPPLPLEKRAPTP